MIKVVRIFFDFFAREKLRADGPAPDLCEAAETESAYIEKHEIRNGLCIFEAVFFRVCPIWHLSRNVADSS